MKVFIDKKFSLFRVGKSTNFSAVIVRYSSRKIGEKSKT